MVDGVSLARLGFATSRENPHLAEAGRVVFYSVGDPFHLRALPAKLPQQPGENVVGIRSTKVYVVQSQQCLILHDYDARSPWIFDHSDFD